MGKFFNLFIFLKCLIPFGVPEEDAGADPSCICMRAGSTAHHKAVWEHFRDGTLLKGTTVLF